MFRRSAGGCSFNYGGDMTNQLKFLKKMNKGKKITIAGFITAILGIVAYCIVGLSMGIDKDFVELSSTDGKISGSLPIALIAIGTIMWIVGQVMYLTAAVDQSFEDEPKQ